MENKEKLIPINIEDEMKSSYIDYSMSVIVSKSSSRCKRWIKTSP